MVLSSSLVSWIAPISSWASATLTSNNQKHQIRASQSYLLLEIKVLLNSTETLRQDITEHLMRILIVTNLQETRRLRSWGLWAPSPTCWSTSPPFTTSRASPPRRCSTSSRARPTSPRSSVRSSATRTWAGTPPWVSPRSRRLWYFVPPSLA